MAGAWRERWSRLLTGLQFCCSPRPSRPPPPFEPERGRDARHLHAITPCSPAPPRPGRRDSGSGMVWRAGGGGGANTSFVSLSTVHFPGSHGIVGRRIFLKVRTGPNLWVHHHLPPHLCFLPIQPLLTPAHELVPVDSGPLCFSVPTEEMTPSSCRAGPLPLFGFIVSTHQDFRQWLVLLF